MLSDMDWIMTRDTVILRSLVEHQGENLRIGAQNMHFETSGAFTGEVSAEMLQEIGMDFADLDSMRC